MKKPGKLIFSASVMLAISVFAFAPWARTRARFTEMLPSAASAGATYKAKCASCHGGNGKGKTFRGRLDHARDFTDVNWQNDVSDERLFNSISNGRGKMPAFKKKLSEQEIDALVTFVRHFKG